MTHAIRTSPNLPGYRMPAEWEPHQATWLSWPHNEDTWYDGTLPQAQATFAQMVAVLARSEPVHINVNDAAMEEQARVLLRAAGAVGDISFHHFPTNDAWCRDHGAMVVHGPAGGPPLVALNWEYNAWGGKYPPYDDDNRMPPQMAAALGVPCVEGGMVLEGGAIEVNGAGLLLTTEACLLHPNRNPHLSRAEIEQRLCAMLGVEKVLWLGEGIVGDDTDGHIDDLARFVAPDTVVTAVEDNPADANYAPLQDNLARLRRLRDQHGNPLRIVTLPMPPAVTYNGLRLPATYANFYIANRVVVVPFFNHPRDEEARRVVQACFPDREVVGIDCRVLLLGLGAVHCLTQQVPRP
jgi:agmatine deiminase